MALKITKLVEYKLNPTKLIPNSRNMIGYVRYLLNFYNFLVLYDQ